MVEPSGIDGARDDADVGDAFRDQPDDLVGEPLLQIDADMRMCRRETSAERFGQELGQRIGVGEHPHLPRQSARIGAEIFAQTLGLRENGAGVLQQRAAGLRRRHTGAAAHQQRRTKRLFHVADSRARCGQRKMCALRAVGDAAGLDHMAKKTEIGQVEAHRSTFVFSEG